MKDKSIFFGRAHPDSPVGRMIKHGHHGSIFLYKGKEDIPSDRKCKDCGATSGSYEAGKVCPGAEMIHIDVFRREVNVLVEQFGNTKSGKKIKKKVNRMYKRDVRRMTRMEVDERLKRMNDLVKDKPKHMPEWLWRRIKNLVLSSDTIEV